MHLYPLGRDPMYCPYHMVVVVQVNSILIFKYLNMRLNPILPTQRILK